MKSMGILVNELLTSNDTMWWLRPGLKFWIQEQNQKCS